MGRYKYCRRSATISPCAYLPELKPDMIDNMRQSALAGLCATKPDEEVEIYLILKQSLRLF